MNQALGQKITLPSLMKFTLPSMVMMLVMSLYCVVDGAFVSRLIGTDAFSAVNIVYPLLSLIVGIGTMFGTGIAAIVSRKMGEGRQQEANENLTFVFVCAVGIGLVLTVFFLVFLRPIIHLLGANQDIYTYCFEYAFPLVFFFPASILQLLFLSLYAANGRPGMGLFITILGGLTNMVLDYVFIALCGWGIAGAAIATGLGYSIPAVFGIYYFLHNRHGNLHFTKPKKDFPVLLHTLGNGSSEMVSNLSTSVTTFLFNIIMMRFIGQNGVAAISIILYLDFILIAISLGYSIGVSPLISYNYGCGDTEKLKKLYRLSAGFCIGTGLFLTILSLVFARPLSSIFAAPGTTVYSLALTGLRVYAFSYLIKGFNIFTSSLFTAFGNGRISALLSCMRTLVFLSVSLIGLSALFQIDGVWIATPVAELLALVLSIFFTVRNRKLIFFARKSAIQSDITG